VGDAGKGAQAQRCCFKEDFARLADAGRLMA